MNTPYLDKNQLDIPVEDPGAGTRRVKKIFRGIYLAMIAVCVGYCLYYLLASDRYVSDATIIIQNTEQMGPMNTDLGSLLGRGPSFIDLKLLEEHLQSIDMLNKLDAALDLRAHYSDSSHDFVTRMWFNDASIEWFHRHFCARVSVYFDLQAGVLRISSQAYTPKMAHDITTMLVQEGERYMNEISHDMARKQINFLDTQVEKAQEQMKEATEKLLAFQNDNGIVSPKDTFESHHRIIGNLESQRTNLQTQLGALPRNLDRNHPTRRAMLNSLQAVEKQISAEKAKLASTEGHPLNSIMEESRRLELDLKFKQDIYKSSLVALETGRMDAARMLKIVSVIQSPTMPEYAMEPRRVYGILSTLVVTLFLLGIARLMESIVLDHVD